MGQLPYEGLYFFGRMEVEKLLSKLNQLEKAMKATNLKSIVFRIPAAKRNVPGETLFIKALLIVPVMVCYGLFCLANPAYTAEPIDVDSQIGHTVINPLIEPSDPPTDPPNNETTVTGLNISLPVDPFDYTQFVFTGVSGIPDDNEYSFLVRGVGENIYQYFNETLYTSTITSIINSPTPYTSPQVTIERPAAGSGLARVGAGRVTPGRPRPRYR